MHFYVHLFLRRFILFILRLKKGTCKKCTEGMPQVDYISNIWKLNVHYEKVKDTINLVFYYKTALFYGKILQNN